MLTDQLFSPDGQRLLLADDLFNARVWDAGSGKPLAGRISHRAAIVAAGFCLDGKRVFTASEDSTVRLGDGATGDELRMLARHPKVIVAAAADGAGRLLATAGDDQQVRLWDLESGDGLAVLAHPAALVQLVFHPEGTLLASVAADRLVRLWQVKNGQLLGALEHPAPVLAAGFGAGGTLLFTRAEDQTVRVWDVGSQRLLTDNIRHEGLLAACITADGDLLATGGKDKAARLWQASTGKLLLGNTTGQALAHDGPVLDAAFSPDGRLLATASEDGSARLWQADGGASAAEPLRHRQAVLALAFDARGERLLTLSADRAARLWEVRSSRLIGQPMRLGQDAADATGGTPAGTRLDNATLVRLGGDRVVSVGGVAGLFTPLTSASDRPLGGDERKNLLAIVDQLKREVAELQGRNLQLQADLDTLRQRPAAPEDFASGVQQSLDELQQRMGSMRNGTSNFAVREFKLDASVHVQVSPLGSIEYRFVQPGDASDPAALSRISMQVVPLPKDNLAGVWTPDLFQPGLSLAALPDIGADSVRRLEAAGLYSIGEYLQVGTRARAQAHLEALLGVQRQRLALWAQQALLMTLRGLGGAQALLLIEAGLSSFERLAAVTPQALALAYDAARTARPDLGAPALEPTLAALWVRGARQYLGLAEPEADVPPAPGPVPAPPAG